MPLSQFEITTRLIRLPAKDLTATEKSVLVTMSTFLPFMRPSHAAIANLMNSSTKTVQRAINALVEKKYLVITEKYDSRASKACSYAFGDAVQLESNKELDLSFMQYETSTHKFFKYKVYWISEEAAEQAKSRFK